MTARRLLGCLVGPIRQSHGQRASVAVRARENRNSEYAGLGLRLTEHLVAILGPAVLAASEPPVVGSP